MAEGPPRITKASAKRGWKPKASIHAVAKCESWVVFCAAAPDYPHQQSRFRSRANKRSSSLLVPRSAVLEPRFLWLVFVRVFSSGISAIMTVESRPQSAPGLHKQAVLLQAQESETDCRSAGHYSGNGVKVSYSLQ